jgi:hypothetical protein
MPAHPGAGPRVFDRLEPERSTVSLRADRA